ncbi:hypothetical protein ADU76_02460 (plasmid) [Clostridium botulinum]|nr:hypothetical protein ADU76_02460 [Clostridium botulinum]
MVNNQRNILSIISVLIIFIILLKTSKIKIDITEIIKKHFKTLKVYGNNSICFNDISLFFILPIFVAIFMSIHIKIDDTRIGIIVTIFTIFIGLLFNILAILLAFDNQKNKNIDKIFIKELLYNVSFAIIISIMVLSISILRFIDIKSIHIIINFLLLYLISVFVMCLFMILKRMFNLLIEKIGD